MPLQEDFTTKQNTVSILSEEPVRTTEANTHPKNIKPDISTYSYSFSNPRYLDTRIKAEPITAKIMYLHEI